MSERKILAARRGSRESDWEDVVPEAAIRSVLGNVTNAQDFEMRGITMKQ